MAQTGWRSESTSRTVGFFFSSRRRHTRYWRDWSSDVCSSDLGQAPGGPLLRAAVADRRRPGRLPVRARRQPERLDQRDRKSVVEGKRVDLGGRRSIKQKKGIT